MSIQKYKKGLQDILNKDKKQSSKVLLLEDLSHREDHPKTVLLNLDPYVFRADTEKLEHELPIYLYDYNYLNDVNYWLNFQIIKDFTAESVIRNIKHNLPAENDAFVWEKHFGKEYAHTIGTAYGWIVNRYKLIDNLIDTIKNNPTDRRMIMSLWQNEFLKTAVLPSCVWCSEWDVTDGKINLWVHQRSCDVPLGLPFNVTQYAVLANLIAQVTGLKVGKMYWSIKDAHIYVNQVDGIKEQIKRFEENGSLPAPKLWINPEVKDFYKFDNSKELKDIKITGYKHMGKIEFPIAQ